MRNIALLFLFFVFACNQTNTKKCIPTIKVLLQKDRNKLAVNDKYKSGEIAMLVDKIPDSLFGAYYFYPSGVLKSYKFYGGLNTYYYNEEYNSTGDLLRIEGGPLVMHLLNVKDNARVAFTYLFPAINKRYTNIQIVTNTGNKFEYNSPLINARFTNIDFVTFQLMKDQITQDLKIISSADVEDVCTKKKWILHDTAVFKMPDL